MSNKNKDLVLPEKDWREHNKDLVLQEKDWREHNKDLVLPEKDWRELRFSFTRKGLTRTKI